MLLEEVRILVRTTGLKGLASRCHLRWFVCFTAIAGLAFISVAASPAGNVGQKATKPILIGRVLGLSGFLSRFDTSVRAASDLAAKEINAKGGVLGRQVKFVDADMKSDISLSGTAAIDVIDKGADLLIAPCDFDYGAPAATAAQTRGIVSFAACVGSLKFGPLGIGPLAFNMGAAAAAYSATSVEWAAAKKGWKKAYALLDPTIVFDKEECASLEIRLKQIGGKLVGKDEFQQKDISIASQIARIKRLKNKPDYIYICSYQPGISTAIRQIRASGIRTPIISEPSLDGNDWKAGVPKASNLYFSTYGSIYGDDPRPAVNKFFRDFRRRTGKSPIGATPITGYAVVQAMVLAIRRAGTTDGKKVAKQLEKFRNTPLIVGPTTFSKFHVDLHRTLAIMQVQNGKTSFVTLWRPKKVPPVAKA
jgi:branched-chain amino acid transport system substrate-binding protein